MIDFGFSIKTPRAENLDEVSLEKYRRLLELTPSFKRCFQCGCCSATCSAGQFTDFSIRQVHTSFRRGEYEELGKELRKCMLCGKCTLVCPRGVNLRSLIINMRQILDGTEKKAR
ncbi:MAG TPA: 4Fe-4S dicluster domain-containing protein [Bacteroidaceae bacterium]|jgi:heterodisulfide reductase subunit C|nr:MAG: acetyl-CoA decarbonylase/synthase complex subunit alpha [Bacteroidetes bacterium ADurb.BinA104]HOD68420.1 4Fe-4S dicluster domain-containing protein [Bacteroidaceae bacterium]HPB04024.1 4Fe-4S dicluster domain-containing protein [Bacteroidaceae bacterium]HPX98752.1 4Fe-4S dicluster domain-containing protein [Bacteroidaceae bacterium]HQL25830.1 4Fe-4S dicluster domain-containing protein [Bacteroidaceae bacterium]